MNWKVILPLTSFGFLMGFASVFGFTQSMEPLLWLGIAFFSAYWIAKYETAKPFLHGFVAAVLMGILNSIIQSAFFDIYLANNPATADQFTKIPGGISGRMFVLLVGPAVGSMYGLFVGLLTFLAAKLFQRKQVREDSSFSK